MSLRHFATLAAVAALGLLVLGSSSASATTVLRTDPGGGLLTGSTTIRNTTAGTAVFETSAGTITCNQTFFDADVDSNSGATSITGRLTTLTFTSCTDTTLFLNFLDCTLHAASTPTVRITGTAGGGTITLSDTVVRCAVGLTACYFTTVNATGAAVNATSSIDLTASLTAVAPTTDAIPAGNCGSTAALTWRLTHIVSATNATVTVTTS